MIQAPKLKTQIVLLTGYLGAGKTTLITYILKTQSTFKVAVIQNEFADEMGIESPLIKDADGKLFDRFYELPNGCICCSAKGELLRAVEFFIQQYESLDFILVETNGLADPSATIQQFWVDQGLQYPAELRVVHAVVPAHRMEELWLHEIFQRQIVFADTILLNFVDKATEEQVSEALYLIESMNPTCRVIKSTRCEIDMESIFKPQPYKPQLLNIQDTKHLHAKTTINHVLVTVDVAYSKEKWEQIFGEILWEMDHKVLRSKGVLKIIDDIQVHSVQGVNDTFEIIQTDTSWSEMASQDSKILFIGETLAKEEILSVILKS